MPSHKPSARFSMPLVAVQIVSTLLCMMILAGISAVFANILAKNDWNVGYFIPTLIAVAITAIANPADWVPWVRHKHCLVFTLCKWISFCSWCCSHAALHSSACTMLARAVVNLRALPTDYPLQPSLCINPVCSEVLSKHCCMACLM